MWCCEICGLPLFISDEEAEEIINAGMMLTCESCALYLEWNYGSYEEMFKEGR